MEYDKYEDAVTVAQRDGLQVIEFRYERADSELIADFTRYHWLPTARVEGVDEDDWYRPDGLDLCVDKPAEVLDNLVERLTRILRDLSGCEGESTRDACGRCAPCRAYESVDAAVRALADVDPDDVEEQGYACTVAADPEVPAVYRTTRILLSDCDENNHQ